METGEEWLERLLTRMILYRWKQRWPVGKDWVFYKGQYECRINWHTFKAEIAKVC